MERKFSDRISFIESWPSLQKVILRNVYREFCEKLHEYTRFNLAIVTIATNLVGQLIAALWCQMASQNLVNIGLGTDLLPDDNNWSSLPNVNLSASRNLTISTMAFVIPKT